ncbi:MAG: hypothetical protein BA874_02225 [Desulfuromonadales bacterium C00003068]|jgi:uncharacterized protein with PIN domain|nr:MAG: hypothetical protein BA874_02225 [Desulfuromonadales bacterium C00003068]
MKDAWKERENAFENQYIYELEKKNRIDKQVHEHEQLVRELSHNRCPKCSEPIQAVTFHGVPLDQCPSCGGVWLGENDLKLLAQKDHRTWFEMWFKQGDVVEK